MIEVDLKYSFSSSLSSSSLSQSAAGNISGGIKMLEEVIQNVIMYRSAPDWLLFPSGSSYYVSPSNHQNHPYGGVVEIFMAFVLILYFAICLFEGIHFCCCCWGFHSSSCLLYG